MKNKVAPFLYLVLIVAVSEWFLNCGPDTPTVVNLCPPESVLAEVEIWRDRAVLVPRASVDLLPASLRHGIQPAMSRAEVEELLAPYLTSRTANRSEFETPSGLLKWSLDREVSGGYEAYITRVYFYPDQLDLSDFLNPAELNCLRNAAPGARSLVILRGDGEGQLATVRIDDFTVKSIIWRQTVP